MDLLEFFRIEEKPIASQYFPIPHHQINDNLRPQMAVFNSPALPFNNNTAESNHDS